MTSHLAAIPRSHRSASIALVAAAWCCAGGIAAATAAEPVVPPGVEWLTGIEFARPADEPLLLNLAKPASAEGPCPAVLCIHGGGLIKGSRGACDDLCLRLAARGYVAATIDYRLVPKHRHPSAIHDAKAAVRWLRAHADAHAIDLDRLGATGVSAGGYLALMLGVTAGVPRFEGSGGSPDQSSAVSCVVNVYGPSDLISDWDTSVDGQDLLPQWFGGPRDTHRAAYVEGSPLAWVTPAAAPTLCIHGTHDRLVDHGQSVRLVERLQEAAVAASLVTIEGAGHGFKDDDRKRADAAMMAFFDEHLRPGMPERTP